MGVLMQSNPKENTDDMRPLCPICNSEMEKKTGKYGYFWGCKNFRTKKCMGTIDIPKQPFEFEFIDYVAFIKDKPTAYLLELIERIDCPLYIKELKDVLNNNEIVKGTLFQSDVEGKISGVFDYLRKHEMFFEMSKLAYWFYFVEGDLQGKLDYWLNRKPSTEFRKEEDIKKSIINYWSKTPLGIYSYFTEEFDIGKSNGEFGGYRVDIVAKDKTDDKLIFIEIKGFNKKAKEAMSQLVTYVRFYNNIESNNKKVNKSYIVTRGYPRNTFDHDLPFDIGMIGYVVEGNKISFIPWKII